MINILNNAEITQLFTIYYCCKYCHPVCCVLQYKVWSLHFQKVMKAKKVYIRVICIELYIKRHDCGE